MFQDGFPVNLREDLYKVIKQIPTKTYNDVSIGTTEEIIKYYQNGHLIEFPYRMYFDDIPDDNIEELSITQKMILHCIYSRNCDGFVRQKHIELLLNMNYAVWTIPYIIKLCDEYVIEILETIYNKLKNQDTELFKKFCLENNQAICKGYDRMVSYWNEYYRYKYNNFYGYVGRKLFKECFGYSKAFKKQ